MKILLIKTLILILLPLIIQHAAATEKKKSVKNTVTDLAPINKSRDRLPQEHKDISLSGPDLAVLFFEEWNYPYGKNVPPEVMDKMWSEIKSIPSETELGDAVENSWRMIGPYGSMTTANARFSGRVTDIEVGNSTNPLIAAASGGLWGYLGFLPVAVSDDVTSLVIGSIATYPGNPSTILLGTGEPRIRSGTGLWRTTNSGTTWTKINISPDPGRFYKIRHQTFFADIVHASTTEGYYRSTDGGLTWTKTLDGSSNFGISDFAVNPNNPNIIYAGKWLDGIYKSTNNGVNWSKVTTPGIPTSDIGRVSLTIGTSNSNKIYALVHSHNGDSLRGIYMSSNEGASWNNVTPDENILGGQGWYNNVIEVCPTNSNIVLAGGVRMWRSSNSGTTWTKLDDDDIHADQHAIEWTSDGSSVYIGNDGGIAYSDDQGQTFETGINYIPITQYVNFDVGISNRGVIYGGSQDNGLTGTTDGGQTWNFTKGGDGGGVAISPISALYVFATSGFYKGDYPFKIYKSTDKGFTWDTNHAGIEPFSNWWTKMRSDRTNPIKLFTNAGSYVYKSTNDGESWFKLNNSAFPYEVFNLNVSKYVSPNAVIYATLNSDFTGQRLRVYDGNTFYERSGGLPTGLKIQGVSPHITNTSTAYALMRGFSGTNQKVYKTTNKGVNWSNISGNLPDVPLSDLVAHPTNSNYLYLGTQAGCYRTTNAGVSWHRWNNGIPDATMITEMRWIDSTLDNGKFYVIASTYGRSFFTREVSGDDPDNTLNLTMFIEGFYSQVSGRTVRDTIRVYLRNDDSPYSIVDSGKAYISTTGTASFTFENIFPEEYYYIHLKHRNSIETWSSDAVTFNEHNITYNFTNSMTKAYGDNMKRVDLTPVTYAVYGGDSDQDGSVDASDLSIIDNDASNFTLGYVNSDLTGDNVTDASDAAIADNNAAEFVTSVTP